MPAQSPDLNPIAPEWTRVSHRDIDNVILAINDIRKVVISSRGGHKLCWIIFSLKRKKSFIIFFITYYPILDLKYSWTLLMWVYSYNCCLVSILLGKWVCKCKKHPHCCCRTNHSESYITLETFLAFSISIINKIF